MWMSFCWCFAFVRLCVYVCVLTETCGSTVCSWGARCVQNTCECPQCAGQPTAQVCGTDGATYSNECELRSESCRQKKSIEVARHGSCDEGTRLIYTHITVSLCVSVPWSVSVLQKEPGQEKLICGERGQTGAGERRGGKKSLLEVDSFYSRRGALPEARLDEFILNSKPVSGI